MNPERNIRIETVPIEQITVVNPRSRSRKKFKLVVASISTLGLKRPITVARRETRTGNLCYDLVCGQGRLEAYKALGQTEVQACVIDASKEDVLLMSLAENLARRVRDSADLMKSLSALKEAGHSYSAIAQKTGLDIAYVKGISRLLNKGEDRLLRAVEKGEIPISIAVTIASSDDAEVQLALKQAYEQNSLRGKALLRARRLIEQRKTKGKGLRKKNGASVSIADSEKLLETYRKETNRQRLLIKRAKVCETRLLFVVSALKELLRDEEFRDLVKSASLDSIPQHLAAQLQAIEILTP